MASRNSGGWISLGSFLLVCLAVAAFGGAATASSVETWYPGLNKPSWNPPSAVFGPVWTLLYIMMAVAGWQVWRRREHRREARPALMAFGVQLALNAAWSLVFFGMRQPGYAAVEIVLLWLAIVATIVLFSRVFKPAAWLLAPYLAWVSFAAFLNFTIWRLNA